VTSPGKACWIPAFSFRIDGSIPPSCPMRWAISAITLAGLSAGPHEVRGNGRVTAAVIAAGRKPRRRTADLMIAANRHR
jgi:hypothetical protein